MSFIDKILPFFVGHRTEILGLITTVVQVLGAFGVIDPSKVSHATDVLVPAMGTMFAAKMSRS